MIGYGVFRQTNMQHLTTKFFSRCNASDNQLTKLTNIFYFGATFIHSLAFDRN